MADEPKLLVILSSGESEKVRTGIMFAYNSKVQGWAEDVKVFFFGPAEGLLVRDKKLQEAVAELIELVPPIACKRLSDDQGLSESLAGLGLEVDFVGASINRLIAEGYAPLVF